MLNNSALIQELLVLEDDRRRHRRYPITMEAQFRSLSKDRAQVAYGKIRNISSGGVLLEAFALVHASCRVVEVIAQWPLLLHDSCSLRLVMRGNIVRADGKMVAVQIDRYEFRTAGRSSSKVNFPKELSERRGVGQPPSAPAPLIFQPSLRFK
jgi:hypothetical protein